MTTVALVVSGHGYGHSVRCAEVAKSLLARGTNVVVHTSAPRWLYPTEVTYHRVETDVGVVQRGGLELDIDATRDACQTFFADYAARVADEAALLRADAAEIVLGDIPSLAFDAAQETAIPSAALGNFAWDWIYAAWPGFESIAERIGTAYLRAERLYRLPLHSCEPDAFAAFTRVEDVPLIARRATRSRESVRAEYGLPPGARVVLLSFGGFHAEGLDLTRFAQWPEYVFVVTPPVVTEVTKPSTNVTVLERLPEDYVSFFAACDAVITKPGYGIVADALANHVAVLFTDRGPFREYPVLAEALPRLGRAHYIPRADLLKGEVGPYLDALFQKQSTWTAECMDGADVVADRVCALLGTHNP